MNVAVIVPTLGRAHALAPLIANLRETTPPVYRVCFVVDTADLETRQAIEEMAPAQDYFQIFKDGTYPVKTNAGAAVTSEPLVLPTADDMVFHSGWYEAAVARFEGPDVHVVGTLDLTPATVNGKNVTMPILRRSYVESPGAAWGETGAIFHPGYHHNAVERELWQLAKHRSVAVFEPESVIEHRHHCWDSREADDTDRKGNMANWNADLALFHKRERLWTA
jgi:glycosyltransferase involved in cell wall biosynthesis